MIKQHILYFYLLAIMVLFGSCSGRVKDGRLLFNQPKPEKGFHFPYLIFVPDNMDTSKELVLIVEPNNSGFVSDNLNEHLEKAKRTAGREFYTGNYIARKLRYPLLVPVFPRPEKDWRIYTHAFDRDAALQHGNELERIDLQLLSMVEDAKKRLADEGIIIQDRILMTGFSASGTFVNRFTAIHPEKVLAAAAGGVNGLLILPLQMLENEPVSFPVGVYDFKDLFGKSFNSDAFKSTPQFWYMGELDENDAVPFDDAFDDHERNQIYQLLGQQMQPVRWQNCRAIYAAENVNAQIKTYSGAGHEQNDAIKKEIVEFFRHILNTPGMKVGAYN